MKVMNWDNRPAGCAGSQPAGLLGRSWTLILGGGTVFWFVTIATSLLPIAAEYRAAFSNWKIQVAWVDSLLAGLLVSFIVTGVFLRSMEKKLAMDPFRKAVRLGAIALGVVTTLIDIPRSLAAPDVSPGYFLIGLVFNAARFLSLGAVIGCLYKKGIYRTDLSGYNRKNRGYKNESDHLHQVRAAGSSQTHGSV